MRIIIILLLSLMPFLCFAQGKVTRPKKQKNTVQQTSVPPKKELTPIRENNSAQPPTGLTPIVNNIPKEPISELANLSIAVEYQGVKYYYSRSEWEKVKDKYKYKKLGIVIKVYSTPAFILSLNNLVPDQVNWRQAMSLGTLPTSAQASAIVNNVSSINASLEYFGGTSLSRDYWTSTQGDGGENWKIFFHLESNNKYTAQLSQYSKLWARSVTNL